MLVFEKSRAGRGMSMLPACDVEIKKPGEKDARQKELHLPQMSENDLSRHYTELAKKAGFLAPLQPWEKEKHHNI